jgi:hypothetical protein
MSNKDVRVRLHGSLSIQKDNCGSKLQVLVVRLHAGVSRCLKLEYHEIYRSWISEKDLHWHNQGRVHQEQTADDHNSWPREPTSISTYSNYVIYD